MDRTHGEALSAFFDGEQVDADLLAESLAQPGAGALLAEFAAMRAEVLRDPSHPTPAFYQKMAPVVEESRLRRLWGHGHVRHALAACLLIAVGMGGFLLGSDSVRRRAALRQIGSSRQAAASQVVPGTQARAVRPSTASDQRLTPQELAEQTAPPAASLRLRFAEWHDLSTSAVEEGGRR